MSKAKRKAPLAGDSVVSPGGKAAKKNHSHEKFAREYVDHGNATLAYRRAFPESAYTTQRSEGSDLLRNPTIIEMIQAFREEDAALINFNRENALRLMVDIAKRGTDDDRVRLAALNDLWEKLGFQKEKSDGNWEVVLERILPGGRISKESEST